MEPLVIFLWEGYLIAFGLKVRRVTVDPVSYTHLDVYKRQELDIPKRGQHQTNSQHRHKESVSCGNGDAGSQCKAEQRCKAQMCIRDRN